jgi:hypothetical protein
MDGLSEDFSGLPEYKTRGERRLERLDRKWSQRRANPRRGHRTRVLLVGGFALALLLLTISLIVLFAPTPYLGTTHGSLESSIGGASAGDCRPAGSGWICATNVSDKTARYDVKVDWAGCWSGELLGSAVAHPDAQPKISGCVSIMDHLTAG